MNFLYFFGRCGILVCSGEERKEGGGRIEYRKEGEQKNEDEDE